MIESGFWIFLVEAAVAGGLFIGLIWWIVGGTAERDRKLREHDEAARKAVEAAAKKHDA
jgi:hypothetical protein